MKHSLQKLNKNYLKIPSVKATIEIKFHCHSVNLILVADLTEIMRSSRDYTELKNAWMGWFEGAGRKIKDDYESFVTLSNEAYRSDGKLTPLVAQWSKWWSPEDFKYWSHHRPTKKSETVGKQIP